MRLFPKVTIMIPTFEQPQYIVQAVESALAQDYSNLEIIVSDDSADNKTEKLLTPYLIAKQIKYYHNVPALGRVNNYHRSLRDYATGDWVLNLDGDDFLINNQFLTKVVKTINENSGIVMIFGREMVFTESSKTFSLRNTNSNISQILDGTEVFFNKRALGINFYHLSTVYSRRAAIDVGFYDVDCLGADTISLMKLLIKNKIAFINEVGGAWRENEKNESLTDDLCLLWQNINSLTVLSDYLRDQEFDEQSIIEWQDGMISSRFKAYLLNLIEKRRFKSALALGKLFKKNYTTLFHKNINARLLIKILAMSISPRLYHSLRKLRA